MLRVISAIVVVAVGYSFLVLMPDDLPPKYEASIETIVALITFGAVAWAPVPTRKQNGGRRHHASEPHRNCPILSVPARMHRALRAHAIHEKPRGDMAQTPQSRVCRLAPGGKRSPGAQMGIKTAGLPPRKSAARPRPIGQSKDSTMPHRFPAPPGHPGVRPPEAVASCSYLVRLCFLEPIGPIEMPGRKSVVGSKRR
jgi:hypothetical protein